MLHTNLNISKNIEKILENLMIELNVKISNECKKEIFCFFLNKIYEISFENGETCEEKFKKILSEEIFFFVLTKVNLARFILESNEEKNRSEEENLNFEQILH